MTLTPHSRPWLPLHPPVAHGQGAFLPRVNDPLSLFRLAVQSSAYKPAIHYFDTTLSYAELDRLAAYKYPRQVEFVPELPKTLTGKILRRELRGH